MMKSWLSLSWIELETYFWTVTADLAGPEPCMLSAKWVNSRLSQNLTPLQPPDSLEMFTDLHFTKTWCPDSWRAGWLCRNWWSPPSSKRQTDYIMINVITGHSTSWRALPKFSLAAQILNLLILQILTTLQGWQWILHWMSFLSSWDKHRYQPSSLGSVRERYKWASTKSNTDLENDREYHDELMENRSNYQLYFSTMIMYSLTVT